MINHKVYIILLKSNVTSVQSRHSGTVSWLLLRGSLQAGRVSLWPPTTQVAAAQTTCCRPRGLAQSLRCLPLVSAIGRILRAKGNRLCCGSELPAAEHCVLAAAAAAVRVSSGAPVRESV